MSLTADDPSRPMSTLLTIAFAYLLGLAVVGYMALWMWLKERSARAKWPPWQTQLALGTHFVLGLGVITIVPATVLHRLKTQGATSMAGGLAFAITVFALIGLGLLIARDWTVRSRSQTKPDLPSRPDS